MSAGVLAVESVTRDFPSVRALEDVSLAFHAGRVHGLVGENGDQDGDDSDDSNGVDDDGNGADDADDAGADSDDESTDESDDGVPGFGVVVALAVVAISAIALRMRG